MQMRFILGEAGTGKTRLSEWLARRAHEVGAVEVLEVIHTRARGRHEGLRGAFERTFRTWKLARGAVYDRLLGQLQALSDDDDQLWRADARALTEYLRPTDDDAVQVDGPRFRFASSRHRLEMLRRVLDRLTDRRPVLLRVDDLQWGPETMVLLEDLAGDADGPSSLFVVATVRSDLVAQDSSLNEQLERLCDRESSRRLSLEPLEKADQRQLLERLLPLEDQLAERLVDRAEGHPLFAVQLLGHWLEREDLVVGEEGFGVRADRQVALPETIHELWLERVGRLAERVAPETADRTIEALELAAALGREVDREEWERLLEAAGYRPPDDLSEQLVEAGLADATDVGWAFTHGLLVDALEQRAREAGRWQSHHRLCGRVLEARLEGEVPGPRQRLAEHWIAAGELERALEPLFDEMKIVGPRRDYEVLDRLYARRAELMDALGTPPSDIRRLEQRTERAIGLTDRGKLEEARSLLDQVWAELDGEEARLASRTAGGLHVVERIAGNLAEQTKWAHRSLEAAQRAEDDETLARANQIVAVCHLHAGDLDRAAERARRSLQVARRGGSRYGQVRALYCRATVAGWRREPSARMLHEQVRKESAEAGFVGTENFALIELGETHRFAGRLDEARRCYRRADRLARQLPHPMTSILARVNLAHIELRRGNVGRAEQLRQSARRLIDSTDAPGYGRGPMYLVRLGHSAGVGDRAQFEQRWERLESGWPEEWRLNRDAPWGLETAGEHAFDSGWSELARAVWTLARELWRELDNDEAADALEARMAEVFTE